MSPPDDFRIEPTPKPSMVWMLSFADLLSLLLAFFVMLFAMNQTESGKWKEAVESLQQRLNPDAAPAMFRLSPEKTVPEEVTLHALDLGYLMPILRAKLAAAPELAQVRLQKAGDRIILSLPGEMLFGPSDADLTGPAKSSVLALANLLNAIDNRVELVGHAEPGIPTDRRFQTGWELSLARALAVAEALRESGYEQEIDVTGLGNSRYAELDASLPEAERRILARRVDLILREQRGR